MKKKAAAAKKASAPKTVVPKYPRHSLEKVLRIPKAILDQNAVWSENSNSCRSLPSPGSNGGCV